jgi:hypothetical protein
VFKTDYKVLIEGGGNSNCREAQNPRLHFKTEPIYFLFCFCCCDRKSVVCCCKHVKTVEEEYVSTEHEMDSTIDRFIINAYEDDDVTKSSDGDSEVDIQEVGPVSSDSE